MMLVFAIFVTLAAAYASPVKTAPVPPDASLFPVSAMTEMSLLIVVWFEMYVSRPLAWQSFVVQMSDVVPVSEKISNISRKSISEVPNNWFKNNMKPSESMMLVFVKLTTFVYAYA